MGWSYGSKVSWDGLEVVAGSVVGPGLSTFEEGANQNAITRMSTTAPMGAHIDHFQTEDGGRGGAGRSWLADSELGVIVEGAKIG